MNRKLIRIFIVALIVNLVVSKSITSDDAEIGLQDQKSPEGPAEEFKAVLNEQFQYIKGKLQEFKEKAEPEYQKFAQNAQPIVDAFSGWVSDKWEQASNGMKNAKEWGKETVDAIVDQANRNNDLLE